METVISGVIVLCLFMKGDIIEHTYVKSQKMADCLKLKRQINHTLDVNRVRMQCGKVDAVLEKDESNGRIRVVKIVKDKYGDYAKWTTN